VITSIVRVVQRFVRHEVALWREAREAYGQAKRIGASITFIETPPEQ
jgi:hypothetical protein